MATRIRGVVIIGVLLSAATAWSKTSWDNPPKERIAGLEHRTFRSASMKVDVGYNICLPPDYASGTKRYPVVYYLHGYTGNESSYLDYAKYWRQSLSKSAPA